jgi:hypothetical protein
LAQNEAAVNALEIERVRPVVRAAFDEDSGMFYGSLKKKTPEVISNRDMRILLKIRPGGKFRHYNPDGGNYGRGSGAQFEKAVIGVQHLLEAVEWTDLSDMATDTQRKAVLSSFKDNLATALEELQRNVDSLCMTDGTGVLGTAGAYAVGTGTGGGDIITMNSDGFRAHLLRFDQDVNIYNAALTVNRTAGAERTINFHDVANHIIHVTPSLATGIATDKIVISGVSATPPVSVFGVPYHYSSASTGTWLGLNRATTPEIRANRVAAGGALALPFARLAMNKVGDRMGSKMRKKRYTAWTHPAQAAQYEALATAVTSLQQMPAGKSIDMYYGDNMQLAGAPLKLHYSWDRTRIDFIDDGFGRAEMRAADFIKKNGKHIFEGRGTDGGLAAYNLLYPALSFNLFHENPAEAVYIDTLSIPSGY